MLPSLTTDLEWQGMPAGFPGDSKLSASLFPLAAVCGDTATVRPDVRNQMSQLVFQDPLHHVPAQRLQLGVQLNSQPPGVGQARRGPKAGIPQNLCPLREISDSEGTAPAADLGRQDFVESPEPRLWLRLQHIAFDFGFDFSCVVIRRYSLEVEQQLLSSALHHVFVLLSSTL